MLRIMTWNICGAMYGGQDRTREIENAIRDEKPRDGSPYVVALQEVPNEAKAAEFAESCQLNLVGYADHAGKNHVAALGRVSAQKSESVKAQHYHKPLLLSDIDTARGPVSVVTLQLPAGGTHEDANSRAEAVACILEAIRPAARDHHLVAGDFNFYSCERGLALMRQHKYTDCYFALHPDDPGATYPSLNPPQRKDYIFASPGFPLTLKSCRVVTEAGHASDHYPVVADFE